MSTDDDYPESPIRKLLRDLNIPCASPPRDPNRYYIPPPTCCGKIFHDPKEATLYCNGCGKVVECNILYTPPYYHQTEYHDKDRQPPIPKRYYACRQNFRTYLNQYMGVGPIYEYDDVLMDLEKHWDVKRKDAYLVGKAFLKKCKSKEASRHYKHLWSFLYRCGGNKPLHNDLGNFKKLFEEINTFQNFFYSREWGFHNVTGTWQILKHLMMRCGHVPYYDFPILINKDKQNKVDYIIQQYEQYVNDHRNIENPH